MKHQYEIVEIRNPKRERTHYGIYLNQYGSNSRILTLQEIHEKLFPPITRPRLPLSPFLPSFILTKRLRAYLKEQGTALFEDIADAEAVVGLINYREGTAKEGER